MRLLRFVGRSLPVRNTRIEFGFCIFLACALLLVPFRLVIAWLLAITIHESFHYLAMIFMGVKVNGFKLTSRGVKLYTAPMEEYQECICALAGPLGGFLLLLLKRWMPCAALCGFVQSCFNLLPIYPLDGGRAIRSLFVMLRNNIGIEKYLANKANK